MKKIFITGAGTSIGKTWITAGLAHQLRQKGLKVEILKPIVTGWNIKENDIEILLEAAGLPTNEENIANCSPWRFKAPLSADLAAAREGVKINFQEVVDFCKRPGEGIKLIEGAGGIMSPLNDNKTFLDLITELNRISRTSFGISRDPEINSGSAFSVILVAGTYLGAITHTLTALKVLSSLDVQLIINESEQSAVSLKETAGIISRFSQTPITLVPRVKSWKQIPDLTNII